MVGCVRLDISDFRTNSFILNSLIFRVFALMQYIAHFDGNLSNGLQNKNFLHIMLVVKSGCRFHLVLQFLGRVLKACRAYPFGGKLVGSMAKRMKLLLEKEGANIGK